MPAASKRVIFQKVFSGCLNKWCGGELNLNSVTKTSGAAEKP